MKIENSRELFERVQLSGIFPDSKTFPDCLPKYSLEDINKEYVLEKDDPSFNLKNFVGNNFDTENINTAGFVANTHKTVEEHIQTLWQLLTKHSPEKKSSLINLPYPYVVPGGRFNEIYYWDSYFTMFGLQISGKVDLIQNMVDNFTYLIDNFGYIPNGNRTYFLGRSQPPFFSLMIKLLAEEKGATVLIKYLPQLLKEYHFWMSGSSELNEARTTTTKRVVCMPDGSLLNRYWDENDGPRPEAFKEDVELGKTCIDKTILFRNIRTACESGWDFSSRWLKDINSFASIHTTEIVPVDLNCLLYYLEKTLSEAYMLFNENEQSEKFILLSEKRKFAIEKYFWNKEAGFYFDYDLQQQTQKTHFTMAGVYPLFFKITSPSHAYRSAETLKEKFLKPGGFVTTLNKSGQQWDWPNGWAPLQWMAIKGLKNYGLNGLAKEAATRWVELNKKTYKRTGKLMEKYNVVDEKAVAGGGEYPAQDGFGWTNGVLLKLMELYT